jgi:hypothetical protein
MLLGSAVPPCQGTPARPDFWRGEATYALWLQVRRKRLTSAEGRDATCARIPPGPGHPQRLLLAAWARHAGVAALQ